MDYITQNIIFASNVADVRDKIHRLCEEYGFSPDSLGKIDLISTEIATNLIKHDAVNGKIRYRITDADTGYPVLELISEDGGPGIDSPEDAVQDGYTSVHGSMGVGLGSIKRLSDAFEMETSSSGTTISIRKKSTENQINTKSNLRISVLTRPHPLENVCGDGYVIKRFHRGACIAVIDGLGHGIHARNAAACAEKYIADTFSPEQPLGSLLNGLGNTLRRTRGAVASICVIDEVKGEMRYAGVGDVTIHVYPKEDQISFLNVPGILGMHQAKINLQRNKWQSGRTVIVMHSDGISSSIKSEDVMRDVPPVEIAHAIMREYWGKNDDATVVVVR